MNCKQGLTKLFAAFVLAFVAVSFIAPVELFGISQFGYHAAEPLARLFQILFILFIISPPLIVVLLFLIWKELKERNKMK